MDRDPVQEPEPRHIDDPEGWETPDIPESAWKDTEIGREGDWEVDTPPSEH